MRSFSGSQMFLSKFFMQTGLGHWGGVQTQGD